MAYIGKTPVIGNFVKLDSITVVNGQLHTLCRMEV